MVEDEVKQLIMRHEGLRLKPYRDSVQKLTIGFGRNLDDNGVREEEAKFMLDNDLEALDIELNIRVTVYRSLDRVRKGVLLNMAYNMGVPTLLGFRRMIAALENRAYVTAALEMLDSRWHEQVGNRARELSRVMARGHY